MGVSKQAARFGGRPPHTMFWKVLVLLPAMSSTLSMAQPLAAQDPVLDAPFDPAQDTQLTPTTSRSKVLEQDPELDAPFDPAHDSQTGDTDAPLNLPAKRANDQTRVAVVRRGIASVDPDDTGLQEENAADDLVVPIIPDSHDQIQDDAKQWLSVGFGIVINRRPPGSTGTFGYTAGGLRYGLTLGQRLLFPSRDQLDSLVIEGGALFYKLVNFYVSGDIYSVFALSFVLRYNVFASESFGIFGYSGTVVNTVAGAISGNPTAVAALTRVGLALGGGFLVRTGPSWYLRGDFGIEGVLFGLLLHF